MLKIIVISIILILNINANIINIYKHEKNTKSKYELLNELYVYLIIKNQDKNGILSDGNEKISISKAKSNKNYKNIKILEIINIKTKNVLKNQKLGYSIYNKDFKEICKDKYIKERINLGINIIKTYKIENSKNVLLKYIITSKDLKKCK